MKDILIVIGFFIAVDILGYLAWSLSGQIPVDGFFLGMLTKGFINLF